LGGYGSEFTRLYKPLKIIETVNDVNDFEEDKPVKIYMSKYGINNVRGGSYISPKLNTWQIKTLTQELRMASNSCLICGKQGHFAQMCPNQRFKDSSSWETDSSSSWETDSSSSWETDSSSSNEEMLYHRNSDTKCFKCGKFGHYADQCYQRNSGYQSNGSSSRCFKCGKFGHYVDQCYQRNSGYQSNGSSSRCFKCGKFGHYADQCYQRNFGYQSG